MNSHQVEPEAVNMIFFYPIKDGFYHKLTHHKAFAGSLVTTAWAICQGFIFFLAIEITGNGALEVTLIGIECMIVHHIHYHTDTSFVQCLYHLLEFFHTSGGLIGISGIGTIGYIIVLRIISPVVRIFIQSGFIYRSVIKRRKQMHVCHAQFDQMVDTCQ